MLSKNPGFVEELEYGVYIWRDGNGRAVADSEYNYMCIASRKGDLSKIKLLEKAARAYGIMDGGPEFCSGSRPVTEEEFHEQVQRQKDGLVPDEYDLANLIDEYRYQKRLEQE